MGWSAPRRATLSLRGASDVDSSVADDFLAAAAAAEEKRGGTVLIASGDRDTFQLASDRTTILYPVRADELARIGPAEVRERYGIEPRQVPDFIALRADPSDKLPGAGGVGATGAASLLKKYGSLEADRWPLSRTGGKLAAFQVFATMNRKAPAEHSEPKADLARSRRASQRVGAGPTRPSALELGSLGDG